jgi:hypothetical protein
MLSTPYLPPNILARALVVLSQARPLIPLITALTLLMPACCLADDFPGCYELQLSKWNPTGSLGAADENRFTLPKRMVLTTTIANSWGDQHGFKVVPVPSVYRTAYWWTKDPHQVHIVWSTGFGGVAMDLEPQGSNLVGTAYAASDYSGPGWKPQQTRHVVAARITCESKNWRGHDL